MVKDKGNFPSHHLKLDQVSGLLRIQIVSASGLPNMDWMSKTDPYCVCRTEKVGSSRIVTKVINDELNPVWNCDGVLQSFTPGDDLVFEVYDEDDKDDHKKDELCGKAFMKSADFRGKDVDAELQLHRDGRLLQSFLRVKVFGSAYASLNELHEA